MSDLFWHPFQAPKVHPPQAVLSLETRLQKAWTELAPEAKAAHGFQRDIVEILDILKGAIEIEGGFLSVLQPPADEERANRVMCPFDEPDKLPEQWNILFVRFGHLC